MLLSLVSRRSLEVDSRDAYGFALRPQHVQRYREYISIYKEEEAERAEKWKSFLGRQGDPAEVCFSDEEFQEILQAEAPELAEDTSEEEDELRANDSGSKIHDSDSLCEHGPGDELLQPEPGSPESRSQLSIERKPAKVIEGHTDDRDLKGEPFGRHIDLVKDEGLSEEPEFQKEKDVLGKCEPEFQKEKDVLEKCEPELEQQQLPLVSEPEDQLRFRQESEPKKCEPEPEKCEYQHEKGQKETKAHKVQQWAQIRPSLDSIDNMMCYRVKKGKCRQKTHKGSHVSSIKQSIPSIEDSEESFGEHASNGETSVSTSHDRKELNDGHESFSPEPFCPWYEELEVLVRLGVPKDLRGEVWQAFVGVKARRIERYYEDMLAQMTNSEENEEHACSSDAFRKWKRQIEKDIPRTFPGHPALNEDGRDSLRRILFAYACHNPSVGYCQAMNFFAGLLLLVMPEENAFWTLVGVIDDYFDGYYTEEMIESQVDQLVFEELIKERFPKLGSMDLRAMVSFYFCEYSSLGHCYSGLGCASV